MAEETSELGQAFAKVFPIESERASLTFVSAREDEGALEATIRIIIFDVDDGQRMVRDIKEQEVTTAPAGVEPSARVDALFEGWARAVKVAFEAYDKRANEWTEDDWERADERARLDYFMPNELLFPDLFKLTQPQTADDYFKACVTSQKRLKPLIDPEIKADKAPIVVD